MNAQRSLSAGQKQRRKYHGPACDRAAEKTDELEAGRPPGVGLDVAGSGIGDVGMAQNCMLCDVTLLELSQICLKSSKNELSSRQSAWLYAQQFGRPGYLRVPDGYKLRRSCRGHPASAQTETYRMMGVTL